MPLTQTMINWHLQALSLTCFPKRQCSTCIQLFWLRDWHKIPSGGCRRRWWVRKLQQRKGVPPSHHLRVRAKAFVWICILQFTPKKIHKSHVTTVYFMYATHQGCSKNGRHKGGKLGKYGGNMTNRPWLSFVCNWIGATLLMQTMINWHLQAERCHPSVFQSGDVRQAFSSYSKFNKPCTQTT